MPCAPCKALANLRRQEKQTQTGRTCALHTYRWKLTMGNRQVRAKRKHHQHAHIRGVHSGWYWLDGLGSAGLFPRSNPHQSRRCSSFFQPLCSTSAVERTKAIPRGRVG